jgi:hypothetical protein
MENEAVGQHGIHSLPFVLQEEFQLRKEIVVDSEKWTM